LIRAPGKRKPDRPPKSCAITNTPVLLLYSMVVVSRDTEVFGGAVDKKNTMPEEQSTCVHA
jgi:hypothetical protein